MRYTPVYKLPALESSSTAKEIYEQSWSIATAMEAAMLNSGQLPIGADLQSLLKRLSALEAGGAGAKFLARGRVAKSVNSVTPMDNFDTPLQNSGFRAWTGSVLTIDKDGDYMVVWAMGSATGLNGGQAFITVNGDAAGNRRGFQDGPSNATSLYFGPFKAGDTIKPWVYTNATGTVDADRTSLAVRAM